MESVFIREMNFICNEGTDLYSALYPRRQSMYNDIEPRDDETLDSLSCGGLFILQKKLGYRYSLDAYLLAAFVDEKPGTQVLDIGSGSGVISIMLAAVKDLTMTGVELQAPMAEMSMRSIVRSGLQDKVRIVCADIREFDSKGVEVIVTNPPYRPVSTGRVNPAQSKALARHEISLDLETLLERSSALLKSGGRFYLVYPAWRLPDLISSMRNNRIEPKRIMLIHSTLQSPAEFFLVCGVKDGGKELGVYSPFIVFAQEGIYTQEMERVFRELRFLKSH